MARDFGRPIDNLIIHCTGTTQNPSVHDILDYWKNKLGWTYPGYHYLIGTKGERHILAHLSEVTNGVKGYNWNSAHISYIGGKDGVDDRTKAQKKEMELLVKTLIQEDILGPNINIMGHRDLSPDLNDDGIITSNEWTKLCPSFDVSEWLKEIKLK